MYISTRLFFIVCTRTYRHDVHGKVYVTYIMLYKSRVRYIRGHNKHGEYTFPIMLIHNLRKVQECYLVKFKIGHIRDDILQNHFRCIL